MNRLTTNKVVDEMSMLELAYNSCYAKDGKAMYRDYDTDVDARKLATDLYKKYADIEIPEFAPDELFDDWMIDDLQKGMDSIEGVLALLYRNIWAMADMRERLKSYEDKQEQGLLADLPCKVWDTVYIWNCCDYVCTSRDYETGIEECPFENECEFEECKEENERLFKTRIESIWNDGQGWYFNVSGLHLDISINAIGKTVFLTEKEAEEVLQKLTEGK